MKRFIALFLLIFLCIGFTACNEKQPEAENKKPNIVCTVFPQYDFVREIAGNYVNLTMLLKPGSEAHSFEPAPKDILSIKNSDLFIMIGGESEEWAKKILDGVEESDTKVIKLIDSVDTLEEEVTEGMDSDEKHHGEYDEHIWTSPENAITMVNIICSALCEIDPENKKIYNTNSENYIQELKELNNEFSETVKNGKRDTIVFADRFPFRYLTESTGLKYYAAFPGCSSKTEPSAATVAFLIDKIRAEKIPAVFCVDYGEAKISESIKRETGVKILKMYSCHIITKEEFENGESYISLMKKNISALKEALN